MDLDHFVKEWNEGSLYKDDIAEMLYEYPAQILTILLEKNIENTQSVGLYKPNTSLLLNLAHSQGHCTPELYAYWVVLAFRNVDDDFLNTLSIFDDFDSYKTMEIILKNDSCDPEDKKYLVDTFFHKHTYLELV